MSAGEFEFLKIIKQAAVEAVEAAQPSTFLFARAINVVKDDEDNTIDFDGYISDKLIIPATDFMVFGKAVPLKGIEEGDKLILLKQAGGQLFYVADLV